MSVTKSAYDFYLTIDGTKYGFMLAEQDGVKQWNDGLAPFLTPQFRTEAFGYEHIPPEIEVPAAAESWSNGAGFDLGATGGSTSSSFYNYSRGLDLSYNDRILLSPERQECTESDLTALGDIPTKFYYHSTFGLYCLAGDYMYRFDLTSQTWVQVAQASTTSHSESGLGDAFYDILEYNEVMYASVWNDTGGGLLKWSEDGLNWRGTNALELLAFTFAGIGYPYADYLTVRGNSSSLSALWRLVGNDISNGVPESTVSPTYPNQFDWSGSDEVGHDGETATGLVTVNNDIFVFKKNGIYVYDGIVAQDVWKTEYVNDYNGRNPFLWIDSLIYVVYEDRLLQFNPYNYDIIPIYPLDAQDSLEVKGSITAVTGDGHNLYVAVKNSAGNTYMMKGRPGGPWHTMAYLGANDCDAMTVVPGGVVHSANPALVFGYGSNAHYFILPRDNAHPDEDDNCRFETTGYVIGPYINFGAKSFSKFLNRASVLGDGLSGGRPATLKYEIDRSGTQTTLVTANENGINEADETSEVSFNQIRYILQLDTNDNWFSPTVDSLALYATLNPRRKRIWKPIIWLSDSQAVTTSAYDTIQPSAEILRDTLFGAVTKRLTLTDDRGNTYTVRLLDIASAGKVAKTIGGKNHDAMGYQLNIVEIRTLTTTRATAIYDQHNYDSGVVYA